MRSINPYFNAIRRADRKVGEDLWKHHAKVKAQNGARAYLESTHDYRLLENNVDTGQRSTMTGREARAWNTAFRASYLDEINALIDQGHKDFKDAGAVLSIWVLDREKEVTA